MVCKDKKKVKVQVKAHSRRVLKCMDKKITKPLKITDFTRPQGYRKSKRKVKKPHKKIPLSPPKKMLKANPTFGDILLSLSPRHNWSGNTLLFSGALLDLCIPSSTVIIFLGLGWFLLRVSLLRSTLLSLLVGSLKLPSRYITTLVIVIIPVFVAPTGPGSNFRLVLSLPVWVWQHLSQHLARSQ